MADTKIRTQVEQLFTEHRGFLQAFLYRRVHRHAVDPHVQEQLAELPVFAGQLDTDERIRRLREVLHQLPAKCQAAVMLQYWHEMSYEQIAQRLGVSTHMVKKYLSQGLTHCRRRMARLE